MPAPARNIQTRLHRQYHTTLQQIFGIVLPVVQMQEDPRDPPRALLLDRAMRVNVMSLLHILQGALHDIAQWFPELQGTENHVHRIQNRVRALLECYAVWEITGYTLAVVTCAVLESFPMDVFATDQEVADATS